MPAKDKKKTAPQTQRWIMQRSCIKFAFVLGLLCCGATAITTGKVPVCGDGVVDAGEECDDGNTDPGDGCSSDCMIEGTCCVESQIGFTGVCVELSVSSTCQLPDVFLGNRSGCDRVPNRCCLASGKFPAFLDYDSFCCSVFGGINSLTPSGNASGTCCLNGTNVTNSDSVCCKAQGGFFGECCGNGIVDPGEECDDSNRDGGDGCSALCLVEEGWSCTPESPSVCTLEGICCVLGELGDPFCTTPATASTCQSPSMFFDNQTECVCPADNRCCKATGDFTPLLGIDPLCCRAFGGINFLTPSGNAAGPCCIGGTDFAGTDSVCCEAQGGAFDFCPSTTGMPTPPLPPSALPGYIVGGTLLILCCIFAIMASV